MFLRLKILKKPGWSGKQHIFRVTLEAKQLPGLSANICAYRGLLSLFQQRLFNLILAGYYIFIFLSSILSCKIKEVLKLCALWRVLICSLTPCSPWRIIDWLICCSSTLQKKPPQTGAKRILTEQRYSLCSCLLWVFASPEIIKWGSNLHLSSKREGCCFLTPHVHPPVTYNAVMTYGNRHTLAWCVPDTASHPVMDSPLCHHHPLLRPGWNQ